jgi:hypothetical protein
VRNTAAPVPTIVHAMSDLLSDLQERYHGSRIILSGLPPIPGKHHHLNDRINQVNEHCGLICRNMNGLVFLSNKSAQLQRDNLHLTMHSRDMIAKTTASHVKKCI